MYEYNAIVKKIIDGDTIDVEVDLGFNVKYEIRLRLSRINAYEIRLIESLTMDPVYNAELQRLKELGLQGLNFVENTIPIGSQILIVTEKDRTEKYGRYLANVYYKKDCETKCLNDDLVSNGFAVYVKY